MLSVKHALYVRQDNLFRSNSNNGIYVHSSEIQQETQLLLRKPIYSNKTSLILRV